MNAPHVANKLAELAGETLADKLMFAVLVAFVGFGLLSHLGETLNPPPPAAKIPAKRHFACIDSFAESSLTLELKESLCSCGRGGSTPVAFIVQDSPAKAAKTCPLPQRWGLDGGHQETFPTYPRKAPRRRIKV